MFDPLGGYEDVIAGRVRSLDNSTQPWIDVPVKDDGSGADSTRESPSSTAASQVQRAARLQGGDHGVGERRPCLRPHPVAVDRDGPAIEEEAI